MKSRLFLPWSLLVGLFLLTSNAEAARATTLILGKSKPEPKIDIPPTAEEDNVSVSVPANSNLSNETINVGNVTKLTGVPQIDYIYDPNLPRELNGFNLTDYPFYNAVPEDIDFKCDGLHDGFYASVPHKCQVYHHCLFGTRYDFLCANYTAFDQKTFICHFASEVDCKNSPRYFNRNEALYKAATTTTVPPFVFAPRRPQQDSYGGRKRKPYRRKKPSYEYYDEYEDAAEDDYYDDASASSRRRKRPRPSNGKDPYDEADDGGEADKPLPPSAPNKSIYDRPRVAPKIRRPVPVNEREKYDYSSDSRIIAKEPEVEKKRVEDSESSGRKQGNNKEPDYYESTGSKHVKNVEPDTEREREREHKERDEYEDRERERDRDRDRERERDRDRDRDRDERPHRDRRPFKKRRRPDDLDDYYDEYEDVRRHRNRNRPRYEEYDDYEYDDRQYRNSQRNRDGDYRSRDHDYDRDKPYRARDPEYERPYRNRDRIRDEDRPIRSRDVEDRPARGRDVERPGRNRDEERPVRGRDPAKDQEERSQRNRNEQPFKSNRNRDEGVDQRPHYSGDENAYRNRGTDDGKRVKDTYREDSAGSRKPEEEERQYKHKEPEDDYNNKQTTYESFARQQDRGRNQERPPRYRESLDKFGKSRTSSREVEAEEPKAKPDGGNFNGGKPRPVDQTERPSFRNDKPAPRPGTVQRTKFPPSAVDTEEAIPEDQSKPVPASRPAYITKPQEQVTPPSRKLFNDQNSRKTNGFKRPSFPRVPTAQEDAGDQQPRPSAPEEPASRAPDQYEDKPFEEYEEERFQPQSGMQKPARYNVQDEIRGAMELNEQLRPAKPEELPVANHQPRLKVPHEDSVPNEELAPRAPKFPITSPRRRPFLPSRNGNANLPRSLLPVGVKAVQPPRGFQVQSKKPEEIEQGAIQHRENPGKQRQEPPNPLGNVEFRAKVTTAIGVDQPKLTQFFQDVQSSIELELPEYEESPQNPSGINDEFYSGMSHKQENFDQPRPNARPFLDHPQGSPQGHPNKPNTQDPSSSHPIPEYTQEGVQLFRQNNNNPGINLRPTLKPMHFPQLSITDAPPPAPPQEERNIQQSFRNRPQPNPVNHQPQPNQFAPKNPAFFPPPPPKPAPSQPQPSQLGPQSFYSENPKFKTTIKVPELQQYKPSGPGLDFNSGPPPQPPVYVAGIRQNLPSVKPEPLRYDNVQRQIDPPHQNPKHLNLKFPPQSENVEDPDEFDVSLNDALQPISTLHPRNVPTGIFLSSWQQPSGGFRRRIHLGGPPARASADPEEPAKQEFGPRGSADSRNVPNQPKNHRVVIQRQASSNIQQRFLHPPVYHSLRPVTTPGNYFAILT